VPSRNIDYFNALIFNLNILKVYQVRALGGQNLKLQVVFKNAMTMARPRGAFTRFFFKYLKFKL